MNILICPDSFKGTLTAQQAADAIEAGLLKTNKNLHITKVPIADGGEGTVEIATNALGGHFEERQVHGPLGNKVTAKIGFATIKRNSPLPVLMEEMEGIEESIIIAIIEAAQANGIKLIPKSKRNPFLTTTYGVGQMIKHCRDKGVDRILLGIGGSCTNDAGIGMLQALGYKFQNGLGEDISFHKKEGYCAQSIETVMEIIPPITGKHVPITILSDVNNPLLGPNGATYIYAEQKGATKKDLPKLEKLINSFAENTDPKIGKTPGSGAAGGLGFALLHFLKARINPGMEVMAKLTNLERNIEQSDLIITGEGRIDKQTEHEKGPYTIAKLAKKHGKKVIGLCGIAQYKPKIFDAIYATESLEEYNRNTKRKNAKQLLQQLASKVILRHM
jgi:glycerate 2-kinase